MVFVPHPSFWNKRQRYIPIPENATEEQLNNINARNKEISFNNRICANIKPYFFGYVYDREMKRYKEHKDKYNSISLKICHKNLSDILDSKECNELEKKIKKSYYKYMPLKRNNSTMNVLTYYVEDTEFDNKWKKRPNNFDFRILMNNENYKPSPRVEKAIKEKIKMFFEEYKNISIMERELENLLEDEYSYENTYKFMYELFDNDLHSVISNNVELCDCVIYIIYKYFKSYNKDVLWSVFGEQILKNLKCKSDKFCYVCESEDGVEYLGNKYKLVEVDIDDFSL